MSVEKTPASSTDYEMNLRRHIVPRCIEDPRREPNEKEIAIHSDGASETWTVEAFKGSFYSKLLLNERFAVDSIHVRDEAGSEKQMPVRKVAEDGQFSPIGARGELPIGALSIGSGRKDNSYATVVKY